MPGTGVLLLALLAGPAPCQEDPLAGGELLLFQDIPEVVSAGREAKSQASSPAPVSVFTARDIEDTGLTSLPDMLWFLPGVDVAAVDRLRYAVGVRGLHSFWGDRTLALIDGRNATHPAWGGTFYDLLPLMAEDIERIEVVRGPIGAAWGANAFNGVVDIVTKKPEDAQGLAFTQKMDAFGDRRTYLRWGSRAGDLFWRISGSYRYVESSSDALHGEDFDSNDFHKDLRFSARGAWKSGKDDRISFGAAHAWNRIGDFELMGYQPRRKGLARITRLFARHDHTFESGTKAYVQFFCNKETDDFPSCGEGTSVEYDLELQFQGTWIRDHATAVGADFRFVAFDPKPPATDQDFRFTRRTFRENWGGIFLSDTWTLGGKDSLDVQLRADRYSETGLDWSGRVSWLRELQDRERSVLRFSLARSFRAPLLLFRRMEMSRLPRSGGGYDYNLLANDDLKNEEIHSIEGGWFWRAEKDLALKVNLYYQFLNELINAESLTSTDYRLENRGRGRAYGGEIEAELFLGPVRATLWYGYNGFHSPLKDRNYRSFRPTDHNGGAKAMVDLPGDFRLALLYRYSDAVRTPLMRHLPVNHRLDLTLGRTFLRGRALFQIGASDLLHRTEPEIVGEGSISGHETPGRTFFARLRLNF